MRIYFQKVKKVSRLAARSPFGNWHVRHGWAYDVWDCSNDGASGRVIGAFYVTLLPGVGGVLHFDTIVHDIPGTHVLAAFRKAIRMVAPHLNVVLITIPCHKKKLISVMSHLGFLVISRGEYIMLQYLKAQSPILNKE